MELIWDKFLLFGDSITEYCYNQEFGFALGPALQHEYRRRLNIIHRGFGGYNSDHAVIMFDKILELEHTDSSKIKIMTCFFGTNDSSDPPSLQHVPVETVKSNIKTIADKAKAKGIKLILIGPGPYNHHQWVNSRNLEVARQRTTFQARKYCDAIGEVAKEEGLPFIPMWYLIMQAAGWKEGDTVFGLESESAENPLLDFLTDGLHYTGPSYKIFYDALMKAIADYYPEMLPDNLKYHMPVWSEMKSIDELKKAIE
ncbi:esterase [Dipodascopsis uninucleata]